MTAGRIVVLRPLKEREFLIKSFVRLGVEIVIADEIGSDLVGFADHQIPVRSVPAAARRGDLREMEDAVCAFHQVYPVDGVITTLDYLLPSVGRINERLGLRGVTEAAGRACFDKQLQREAFERAGVPSTAYRVVQTLGQAVDAAGELGFPLVLKPTDRTGSRGVVRVDSMEQLPAAFAKSTLQGWSSAYLAESYLEGPEIAVETVTHDGETSLIAVNRKRLGPEPDFVEVETIVPGGFDDALEKEALEVVAAAIAALGVTDTVTHTELRLTASGPRVLEVNGRIAGGCIADMLFDATGMNLYEAQWDVLRGMRPEIVRVPRHFLSRRAVVGGVGTLTSIGIGTLPSWNPAEHGRLQTFTPVGAVLAPVEHSNDIKGYAIGRGPDVQTASERAAALVDQIQLNCE